MKTLLDDRAFLTDWTLNSIDACSDRVEPPLDIQKEISQIKSLPPLPGIADRIMKLSDDPMADSTKLAKIIELDPLLTAQVIRWASSALYGYAGKVSSVKIAITHVLGYQYVFNLVLGLSALSPLKAPSEGVIGITAFWTHALASTHLMKALNEKQLVEQQTEPQTVFSVALLHNIGFPLLGHQFRDKFWVLSKLIEANPELNPVKLESFSLGATHCELGSWLLKTWSMPHPIIDVVYNHHNPNYKGNNHQLNLLTYLNDILLAQLNIGVGFQNSEIEQVLETLQLTQENCDEALEKLNNELISIKALVDICTLNK